MRSRPGDRRLPLLVVDVVSNKPPRPVVTRLFRSLLLNSARAAGVAAIRIGKATAQSDTVPTATPRENQKTHRENQRTNNSPGPMSSGRYIFLITGTANRLRAIPGSHATQPIHACQTRTIASTNCEYRPIANIDLPSFRNIHPIIYPIFTPLLSYNPLFNPSCRLLPDFAIVDARSDGLICRIPRLSLAIVAYRSCRDSYSDRPTMQCHR